MGWICRTCGSENRFEQHICPVCLTKAAPFYRGAQRLPDLWQHVHNEGMAAAAGLHALRLSARARTGPLGEKLRAIAAGAGNALYRFFTSRGINRAMSLAGPVLYILCLAVILSTMVFHTTLPGPGTDFSVSFNAEGGERFIAAAQSIGSELADLSRQASHRADRIYDGIEQYSSHRQAEARLQQVGMELERIGRHGLSALQEEGRDITLQLERLWPAALDHASDFIDRARDALDDLLDLFR